VILENLEGYNTPGVPVVINLFGSPERTAMILGTKKWEEAAEIQTHIMKESWPEPKLYQTVPANKS
jgi:UbiD family decarboxylase